MAINLSGMGKRTAKAGIVGKYGPRYSSTLRRIVKKFEISQRLAYECPFCGKVETYHPGRIKEKCRRNLELQGLQEKRCRRCLDSKVGLFISYSTNVAQAAVATLARVNKDISTKAAAETAAPVKAK